METKEIAQIQMELTMTAREFTYKGRTYSISSQSILDQISDEDGEILEPFEDIDEEIAFYASDEDFALKPREFRKAMLEATEWE
tara:strand:- start:170 stop:421 length:252 start_codon:yes stop_codon:yes gene_type:complete